MKYFLGTFECGYSYNPDMHVQRLICAKSEEEAKEKLSAYADKYLSENRLLTRTPVKIIETVE